MPPQLVINLTNNLSEIPRVLDAIGEFLDGFPHDGSARFDVSLAVEELLSNIIRYAYPQGETHMIGVTLSVEDEAVHCRLVDSGQAFDPLSVPEPDFDADLDERKVGGLGVHFVRQMMQDLRYDRIDGQNVIHMSRTLDAPT